MKASSDSPRDELIEYYFDAKKCIINSIYYTEVNWQFGRDYFYLSEHEFLKEYSWVVLNSGFRERIVRKYFDYISLCFCDWECAKSIVDNQEACVASASFVFNNPRKLRSIVNLSNIVLQTGFDVLKLKIRLNPLHTLQSLPFIGKITAFHLAKNIGLNVAKPDRHMSRLSSSFGYDDTQEMCKYIHSIVGDPVPVIDLILWRYQEISSRRHP